MTNQISDFQNSVEEGMGSDCLIGIESSMVMRKIFWN